MQKIKRQLQILIKSKTVWFFLVFGISLTVYLFTLCPTIYLEDAAEFVTVAETLGIPHPSGYPLYVVLGKFFSLVIPIGTAAWKINFMSAFFGALSIAFIFLIIRKILFWVNKGKEKVNVLLYNLSAFSGSLILAFTLIFWSQSIVAEVYTLNTFFVAVIFYLLLIWTGKIKKQEIKKADKILLFTIFLFGISLTNHQMMVLLTPIFLIYVIWVYPRIFKDYKLVLAALFLVVLGLSLYLYLPLRAEQNPAYNWGDPQTLHGFKNQVLRQQYKDLNLDSDKIFNKDKLPFVGLFFKDILIQFTLPALFIVFIGFLINYLRDKKTYFMLLGIFIFNSLIIVLLRTTGYSEANDVFFRVYYLPAYLSLSVWLGVGVYFLIHTILKFIHNFSEVFKITIISLLLVIVSLLPFSFLINNWSENDRSDFWMVNDWARAVLESMDQDSYLVLENDQPAFDSMLFSLFYMQAVENVRRDVRLVNFAGIKGIFFNAFGTDLDDFYEWNSKTRKHKFAKFIWDHSARNDKKSTYILYPLGKDSEMDIATRSNGIVYKIYENIEEAKKDKTNDLSMVGLRNMDYEPLEYNIFYADFLSDYYLARTSFFLENGYINLSQNNFLKSIQHDSSPFSFNYQAFVQHRGQWINEN